MAVLYFSLALFIEPCSRIGWEGGDGAFSRNYAARNLIYVIGREKLDIVIHFVGIIFSLVYHLCHTERGSTVENTYVYFQQREIW